MPYPPLRFFQSGRHQPRRATIFCRTAITPLTSCLTPGVHFTTAALTPAVDCRQRESICLRESVKESQAQADSPAEPRKPSEAHPDSRSVSPSNVKTEAKADSPAKTAGEEKTFSVEKKKTKADPDFPPWTGLDVSQIRKRLSAFMEGEEPPIELIEWICTTFEGFCPARDVFAALEAAWSRSAAPGKKNAPRSWNWFYSTLRNALIPGEAARLPEQPAVPHPDHTAKPAAIASGIGAIELAKAPRSIVESAPCAECGGCALARYTDGTIASCGCHEKRGEGLKRIGVSSESSSESDSGRRIAGA